MSVDVASRDELEIQLSRASYELARARLGVEAAALRAAESGMTQRAIATLLGTNQASVHRLLAKSRNHRELSGRPAEASASPEARFHFELHREIAHHILAGSWSPKRALRNLEDSARNMGGNDAKRWIGEWRRILELGPADLVDAILALGPDGDDLRQVSPLTGIVTPEERAAAVSRAYSR